MGFFVAPAKEVQKYIGISGTILVDLRDAEDYDKGHIATAINIPFDNFECSKEYLSQYEVIILYCERGNTSLLIARDYKNGNQKVFTLSGGYLRNKEKFVIDGTC